MRLTPIQIRKQEFAKKMRGFDPEEVEAFLTTVASDFEELLKENMDAPRSEDGSDRRTPKL